MGRQIFIKVATTDTGVTKYYEEYCQAAKVVCTVENFKILCICNNIYMQAGHDLKSLSYVLASVNKSLHAPLMCVVDYKYVLKQYVILSFVQFSNCTLISRGYRALVMTAVPIRDNRINTKQFKV